MLGWHNGWQGVKWKIYNADVSLLRCVWEWEKDVEIRKEKQGPWDESKERCNVVFLTTCPVWGPVRRWVCRGSGWISRQAQSSAPLATSSPAAAPGHGGTAAGNLTKEYINENWCERTKVKHRGDLLLVRVNFTLLVAFNNYPASVSALWPTSKLITKNCYS